MSKNTFAALVLLVAMISGIFTTAQADVPKDKSLPLENVLRRSFRERESDQVIYSANSAAIRPDDQARREMKEIRVEIGDELAGPGELRKRTQDL